MIRIFSAGTTNFSTMGLGAIPDAISCKVVEGRNSVFELAMIYPVSGIRYQYMVERNIIVCKSNPYSATEQAFEIYRIVKGMRGLIEVYAQHISYRLSYIPVAPFTADSLRLTFQGLLDNAIEPCPFTFWSDIQVAAPYVQTVPASIRQRLGGEEGSVLDLYGGEYEWDNFTVKLWARRGQDRNVTIRYGKNLLDLMQEQNIVTACTGIVPYWTGTDVGDKTTSDDNQTVVVMLPERVLHTDNVDLYPYRLSVALDMSSWFDGQPTEDALREAAERYIEDNDLDKPIVNLKVSFIDLRRTTEYANVAPLEQVMLCDTVKVFFEKLGVSATAKVIKTTYDAILDQYDSIELGDTRADLTSTIRGQEQSVVSIVEQSAEGMASYFSDAIDAATTMIQGGYGGYVVINKDENGYPSEIVIMDKPSTAAAQNCIKMNSAGIGFSQTGYNGTFTSAWTIDGTFDAQKTNVINLNATSITGGVLKSSNYDPGTKEGFLLDLTTGDIFAKAIDVAVGGVDVTQKGHFIFKDDWGGNTIGAGIQQGNNLVLITGDAVKFIQDMDIANPVAQIDQKKLVVTHGNFKDDLRIGQFKFIPRSNGNLSLVYVGTEDE